MVILPRASWLVSMVLFSGSCAVDKTDSGIGEEMFWGLVERVRLRAGGDESELATLLREDLRLMSVEQLVQFERCFLRADLAAYSMRLWDAAYIIDSGCSDDGFAYFRTWLIWQGRKTYDEALRDPDSLAAIAVRGRVRWPAVRSLGIAIYKEKTGRMDLLQLLPDVVYPSVVPGEGICTGLDGRFNWDAARAKFPKLCARFGR